MMITRTIVLTMVCTFTSAGAFEVPTHKALSRRAVDASRLDSALRDKLAFDQGAATGFVGSDAKGWIEKGSDYEDDRLRFFNHFHNPQLGWNGAGLLGLSTSSVVWAQDQSSAGNQDYSWKRARSFYYDALTQPDANAREASFAKVFRALGQQVHLIQDAALPAHTRDDPHPKPFLDPDLLETHTNFLVEKSPARFVELAGTPQLFDPSLLAVEPSNALAPIPIARIIDSTDGPAAAPSAGHGIGIAEYSHLNFVSNDTIFLNDYPRLDSLDPTPFFDPPRFYRSKVSQGAVVEHFLVEGVFFEALRPETGFSSLGYNVDDRVVEDYAALLLPRAIGYSAGAIDYFFRGKISLDIMEDGSGNYRLTNAGAETMEGVFEIHYDDRSETRHLVTVTEPTSLDPGQSLEFYFEPATDPPPKVPGRYVVAFKGRMGNEVSDPAAARATFGQVVDLPCVAVADVPTFLELCPPEGPARCWRAYEEGGTVTRSGGSMTLVSDGYVGLFGNPFSFPIEVNPEGGCRFLNVSLDYQLLGARALEPIESYVELYVYDPDGNELGGGGHRYLNDTASGTVTLEKVPIQGIKRVVVAMHAHIYGSGTVEPSVGYSVHEVNVTFSTPVLVTQP